MKQLLRSLLSGLFLAVGATAALGGQQVVFSEVMYNPTGSKPEFIEVWNISNTPLDMAKWRFSNGVRFEFPDFTASSNQAHFLKGKERIIVSSADAAATRAAYPTIPSAVRIFGPWEGALDNDGETVTLEDKNGVAVTSLEYGDDGHWPVAADGAGHSLVLANENRTFDDWRNWRRSNLAGGSPGAPETVVQPTLFISEAHFTATNRVDWVEIHNAAAAGGSLDGLFLASTSNFADKVPLSGAISPRGYASWNVDFAADNSGTLKLFLVDSSNNVIAAVKLTRVIGRDSLQEFPAQSGEWYSSTTSTRDAENNPERQVAIVINEIMVDPPSDQNLGEFIELHNRSASAVDLSGWRLDEAVDFVFPQGSSIPAGGYLVVGGDMAFLQGSYPGLTVLGNWRGQLRNGGEMIRLLDQHGNPADIVDYKLGGDWPELANGLGSSLELVHPEMDNNVAGAWRDSDESNKSTFESFAISGVYRRTQSDDELHLRTVGDAHMILRNITMSVAGGANVLTKATQFSTTGLSNAGWLAQGTHWATHVDANGWLNLISDGRGDVKGNRAELDAAGLLQGSTYTLRFEARWVSGKPRLVAQTFDTNWGGTVLLPIPSNLGTPGAVNSRAQAAAAPQVASILHSPAVPRASAPVKVTARVVSNVPLASVELFHRLDDIGHPATHPLAGTPINAFIASPMFDDGTNGDVVANDGTYTATVTRYGADNSLVHFYVQANGQDGSSTTLPKRGPKEPAYWVVENSPPSLDMNHQRIVVSALHLDALNTGDFGVPKFQYDFPRMSQHLFNATFIFNESEIIYNCGVRKGGSPWTREAGNSMGRARIKFPGDRPFRGREDTSYDDDAANPDRQYNNRIVRYWLYLFGHPALNNEFVRVAINGNTPNIREDYEPYGNDFLNRNFENGSSGQLFEIDDTFYFSDDGNRSNEDATWDYENSYNPVLYHDSWPLRTRETEYDYGALIDMMRLIEQNQFTKDQIDRLIDPDSANLMAALRGYIGDWDTFTRQRGKNAFFYRRPDDGRGMFMHWDSDLAWQSGDISDPVLGDDNGTMKTNVANYFRRPYNLKLLNYYLTELLTKFTEASPRMTAFFQAEENASTSFTVNTAKYTNWFSGRKSRIQTDIGPAFTTPFALTNPPTTTTAATVLLAGTAPSNAYRVEVVGHPEAVFTWLDTTRWNLSAIRLRSGDNVLTLQTVNAAGAVISTLSHTVTKEGDAAPVLSLTTDPKSGNVALSQAATLDASGSYDPEGTPLAFTWSVTPQSGVRISDPARPVLTALFSTPGIYTFTLQSIDGAGSTTTAAREITVYSTADFYSFGSSVLSPDLLVQNVEPRDNYSPSAWYSLQDDPGQLNVMVLDNTVKPLGGASFTHPLISRALPSEADWVLQTDLTLETRQYGTFSTGLRVELMENGEPVRYVFGLLNGTQVLMQRSAGAAGFVSLVSPALSVSSATLRVRRSGSTLRFDRRVNDAWISLHTVQLPAATTADRGGIFVATSSPQTLRTSFDYLLVVDPGSSTGLAGNLRISEIMYNPSGAAGVEFLELTNIGVTPLSLQGARFDAGLPFDQFVFGGITLQPGGFTVVTNDIAGFQARYGNAVPIAGQFTGSLSNGGERIVLRDADGNVVIDFTYDDEAPWPTQPDGSGVSLEMLSLTGDYTSGSNWRPSAEIGGSPGMLGVGFDTDGDGFADRMELQLGTNMNDAASTFQVTSVAPNAAGEMTLTWPSALGAQYRIEYCTDLGAANWQTLATVPGAANTTTFTDVAGRGLERRFYRVIAIQP